MRAPPRWGRCLGEGSTTARPQDSGTGVVLVKLRDRRDPDVVQNCIICRHVVANAATGSSSGGGGGGVQGCVDRHRPVSDHNDDNVDDDDVMIH